MKRLFKKKVLELLKQLMKTIWIYSKNIFKLCFMIFFFYFTPIIINFADNKILTKRISK